MRHPTLARLARAAAPAALLALAGCASPLEDQTTDALRRSIAQSVERELAGPARQPEPRPVEPTGASLDIPPDRVTELEQMAGPSSYAGVALNLTESLLPGDSPVIAISLRDAVSRAVKNNLDVEAARLQPAIAEAQLVAAEAVFDWAIFASFDATRLEQPQIVPVINGVPVGSALNERQTVGFETGVRKRLTTGGQLQISQGLTVSNNASPGVDTFPDPAKLTNLTIALGQPLLRGFGDDATLAEIRLARNFERDAIQLLRQQLLQTVTRTEEAYWNLLFARINLAVRQRLLDRGVETRDVLRGRLDFDVKPAEYSDAVARVEQRRSEVIRAAALVRQRSDELKAFINDPDLPVGAEIVLAPLDRPATEPITFSLYDALRAALAERPEIQRAILAIDDASIRQRLADNLRLPQLDLNLQARFSGLDEDVDDAYEDIGEARFVDYILGLIFEQPIGNRAAEALSRQRRLERMQAVVNYRNTIQQVTVALKTSLRSAATNFRLIEQTRVSRLAASENLRTLQVEEENIRALTPDFLDLKLRRQEALAQAELEEVRALVDYNISLAQYYAATGAALERNQIELIVQNPGDELPLELFPPPPAPAPAPAQH